jgi:hypothetical protein
MNWIWLVIAMHANPDQTVWPPGYAAYERTGVEYITLFKSDTVRHNNRADAVLNLDVEQHFHPHVLYRLDSIKNE